jgi:N,N'-diacetylchitobiose transport system permease protein
MSAARNSRVGTVAVNSTAAVVFVIMVFPVYWMVNTALKPRADVFTRDPKFFPNPITFEHFARVINDDGFMVFARNSLVVTLVVVVLSMIVAFLAATAVARFRFKGRRAYIVMILAVQMVPFEALLISMFVMLNSVGLVDKLAGVMVAYLAFVLPFTIWTLRGFVANVPVDLEEAAMIDGCSRAQAFRRVLFPLIMPGLVATSVFAFIQAWNEFILANVILLSETNYTLPIWLASFQSNFKETDWSGLMAGSTLFAIPVIVFFVLVQGRIQSGALAGGVKG